MSATLFSSFLVFIFSGVYTLGFGHDAAWVGALPRDAGYGVKCATAACALYFFYYAAVAEIHEGTAAALRKIPGKDVAVTEWWIRCFNQSMMLLLWVVFVEGNAFYFVLYLLVLYFSFILWDLVTWRALKNELKLILMIFDLAGFFVGALGLWYFNEHRSGSASDIIDTQWMLGVVSTVYVVLALVGVLLGAIFLRFWPFSFEHYHVVNRR